MKKVLGVLCMAAGAALLIGALSLFLWNRAEANRAEQTSVALMPLLNAAIAEKEEQEATVPVQPGTPLELLPPEKKVMTEVEIDGHSYIGYLSVPSLSLELPVMSQWNYDRLKIAPCRYSGTTMEENLVLVAHNYPRHFGHLNQLHPGDEVLFTDMDGTVTVYQVAATDVVPPTSAQEVASGAFDLALVTCTYGGKTRLVVYCDEYSPR